jgi:transcriptional regulator with XRE-family HTH domain
VVAPKLNALGDYLRARREQLRPEDVGLIAGARRRVPGLRREELAMLAGISPTYYLRLEQGRDTHPSAQIVDALARALRLDDKGIDYLHRLASATPIRRPQSTEEAPSRLHQLINQLPLPAVLLNRYEVVLAANPSAGALSPGFTPGQNFLRWLLLDPGALELYLDWDAATAIAVSETREVAGSDLDDPGLRALIDELAAASERFREVWARADVGYHTGVIAMRHPRVGEIHLHRTSLTVPHSTGQHLLIYHAEPGSPSAHALEELVSTSMGDHEIGGARKTDRDPPPPRRPLGS